MDHLPPLLEDFYGGRMTQQCKCEHWETCPVCCPEWYDMNGNRNPLEPTPLQAARAEAEKWKGDSAMKRDTNLLHYVMCSQKPKVDVSKVDWSQMQPSLIEELDARGYDLTTLRFSIKKKAAHGIGEKK